MSDRTLDVNHDTQPGRLRPGRLSDHEYRLMIDTVADYAIYFLDPSGVVLSWNRGAELMKGYLADEIIGRHFSLFYPSEALDRGWPARELNMAMELGRVEDEGWRLRKDGSRFWASVLITKLVDSDGNVRGFSKITRDLTEQRRREELLRHSEERFRLLVEGVKDYAIFMLDPAGFVISWNSGARKNKGYEEAEIIGKHFSVFYPPEVAAAGWPDHELSLARKEGRYEEEGWRVRKDGSRFWASVVITALWDQHGRHRGFAKVTRDLTDKKIITALEDESKRTNTFIAMLSHELRNPLAPISNAVALLEMQPELSEPARLARDIISRQLKQMTRLVDDLLDISRINAGKIHLERKPVLLEEVLDEAIEASKPLLQANAHSFRLEKTDTALWVNGDRARLIQIVCNLLNNAAKFTPRCGQVTLSLVPVGPDAEIRIKDNGPGIAPNRIAALFLPFAQGEEDAARTLGGLGLGLSMVQELTTLQGGTVRAFSTGSAGQGSEFVVSFPTIAAPTAVADAVLDLREDKLVLVVDDQDDAARTMATLVDLLGYRSLIARNGLQAIEIVKAKNPDLVLLDIGLPGMDGIEVAKRLTAEMINPPSFIAITGYGQESDRQRTFSAGFYAHLTKPVRLHELKKILKTLFEM